MNRKSFIKKATISMFAFVPFMSWIGCSSDDDNTPPPNGSGPDCLGNGTNTLIGSNHGHSITVPKVDVENGSEKIYNIQGSSGHSHTVTVTAADFAALQSNQSVTISSTQDSGHTHSVSISCA